MAALFAMAAIATAQAGEFRDFVVQGAASGATQIELSVIDPRGKPLDGGVFDVKEHAFSGSVPVPLNTDLEIRALARDAKGNLLAEGTTRAYFDGLLSGSGTIDLRTRDRRSIGSTVVSGVRLQLDATPYDPEYMRYELQAFDAYGNRVELDPKNVSWSIPYPPKQIFTVCKPGHICVELKPPRGGLPQVNACLLNQLCIGATVPPDPPPPGYTAIATGHDHTCALTNAGRIKCWGANELGQLGRSTTETCQLPPPLSQTSRVCSRTPQEISCPAGAPCSFTALDAGWKHTCAIDVNGNAWCWGSNNSGESGVDCNSGNPSNCRVANAPQLVTIPAASGQEVAPRFMQISAGIRHTCAVSAAGNVFCWGDNASTQSGGLGHSADAHQVVSARKYKKVSTGEYHSCAITTDDDLDCWGDNLFGALKPWPLTEIWPDPRPVRSLHPQLAGKITAVTTNRVFTCASDTVSGVVCWGGNDGSNRDVIAHPAPLADLELAMIPSTLDRALCGIEGGQSLCGWPAGPMLAVPSSPTSLTRSAVGSLHHCVIRSSGEAFCRGHDNTFGVLGDGSTADHNDFGPVLGP